MSKTKKLVYQVFNCATCEVEERTVTVNNKETARLASLGIEAERKGNLQSTRTMFYYAFIEIINTYFKSDLSISLKNSLETRRPNVSKGRHQVVDIVLESLVNSNKYAIKLFNESYVRVQSLETSIYKYTHINKLFDGRLHTIVFKDFNTAAANVVHYAAEIKQILTEMKTLGMVKPTRRIPTVENILKCLDNAVESTVTDKQIELV